MGNEARHEVNKVQVGWNSLQYSLQATVDAVPETRYMVPRHYHHHKAPCEVDEL